MYDRSSDFWQMLFHICTGLGPGLKRSFWGQFFSAQMRFYRQMLMAAKVTPLGLFRACSYVCQTAKSTWKQLLDSGCSLLCTRALLKACSMFLALLLIFSKVLKIHTTLASAAVIDSLHDAATGQRLR